MSMQDNSAAKIGAIGEDLVVEFFDRATKSKDWYDSKKDGKMDGLTYEVKTHRLNYKWKGFWILENQFKKLDNVDILFFVQVPESEEDALILWLCTNHKVSFEQFNFKGKTMRNYPLSKCLYLGKTKDERANQVLEYSQQISTVDRFKK